VESARRRTATLPNDPGTRTTRRLVETGYRLAGQPRTKLRMIPPLLLRAIALANPTVRELLEMRYQLAEPFIVDSNKITTRLGITATPLDQAIADTLDTYRHDAAPTPDSTRTCGVVFKGDLR
jgi:nucleoside-diphosphate-sugar epimerase